MDLGRKLLGVYPMSAAFLVDGMRSISRSTCHPNMVAMYSTWSTRVAYRESDVYEVGELGEAGSFLAAYRTLSPLRLCEQHGITMNGYPSNGIHVVSSSEWLPMMKVFFGNSAALTCGEARISAAVNSSTSCCLSASFTSGRASLGAGTLKTRPLSEKKCVRTAGCGLSSTLGMITCSLSFFCTSGGYISQDLRALASIPIPLYPSMESRYTSSPLPQPRSRNSNSSLSG
ncbi:hypothetical protein OGAPHI_000733 [Ogataea philodendri]|uniref:Uncharacterized protein n=1 Tax=Ogataea philodendri TaxID=1378263 RepID=A0A9P8PGU8_9ASCO|nr:uncharacterized protein OGAPHI_000733 [Ogataea philodendri]KAH3671022.1 hypothetical protein OGAPHI_000733 [Ogataea philodendri]